METIATVGRAGVAAAAAVGQVLHALGCIGGTAKDRSVMPRPFLLSVWTLVLYGFILKRHTFIWLPVRVGVWSRGLPARSSAPVVTVAL